MENHKNEELLYEQLLGIYHSCPKAKDAFTQSLDRNQWEMFNGVIDDLVKLGHDNYEKYKIIPEHGQSGSDYIRIATLQMKMMAVIRSVASEFGLEDPGYALSQYGGTSSWNVSQSANPVNTATAQQEQNQHQETILTLEQHLEKLQSLVDQELTEEQIIKIKDPLEKFKQDPSKWQNAQKLILVGATFTRDVAVQFIGSVLAGMTIR